MDSIDLRLRRDGIRAMLNLPGVRAAVVAKAQEIAAAADAKADTPGGHAVLEPEPGDRRTRVAVLTVTGAAIRSEAKNRTLTRSITAGRRAVLS